jgi:Tol biopolymer transport system component
MPTTVPADPHGQAAPDHGTEPTTVAPTAPHSSTTSPSRVTTATTAVSTPGPRPTTPVAPTSTTATTGTTMPAQPPQSSHQGLLAFFDYGTNVGLRVTDLATGTSKVVATNVGSYGWSPDGGHLVYADLNGAIWTTPASSPNPTRLSPNGSGDSLPAWSPQGDKIAFLSNKRVYVMNSDGTGRLPLSDLPTDATTPTWAPDGTRLAFVENDPNAIYQGHSAWSVWIVNTDGTNLHKLSDGNYISWSPDGNYIFFVDGVQLIVEHPDGSGRHPLFSGTVSNTLVDWTPDSRTLAVSSHGPDGDALYAVSVSDGTYHLLSPASEHGSAPTWSADGTYLVYNGPCGTSRNGQLCLVNADGTGLTTLVDTPSAGPHLARPEMR